MDSSRIFAGLDATPAEDFSVEVAPAAIPHNGYGVVAPIEVARAEFLRIVIPQLREGGFDRLAAKYGVELARLEALEAQL